MKKDITGEDVIDAREVPGDVCNRVLKIMQRATRLKRKFTRKFRLDQVRKCTLKLRTRKYN